MFFSLFHKTREASRPAAHDDYWYAPIGSLSQSGMRVTPETALKASACYAAVIVLCRTIAPLPRHIYERIGGEPGARKAMRSRASWDCSRTAARPRRNFGKWRWLI